MNGNSKTSGVSRQGRSAPATTTAAPGGTSSAPTTGLIHRETLTSTIGRYPLGFLLAAIRRISTAP